MYNAAKQNTHILLQLALLHLTRLFLWS